MSRKSTCQKGLFWIFAYFFNGNFEGFFCILPRPAGTLSWHCSHFLQSLAEATAGGAMGGGVTDWPEAWGCLQMCKLKPIQLNLASNQIIPIWSYNRCPPCLENEFINERMRTRSIVGIFLNCNGRLRRGRWWRSPCGSGSSRQEEEQSLPQEAQATILS